MPHTPTHIEDIAEGISQDAQTLAPLRSRDRSGLAELLESAQFEPVTVPRGQTLPAGAGVRRQALPQPISEPPGERELRQGTLPVTPAPDPTETRRELFPQLFRPDVDPNRIDWAKITLTWLTIENARIRDEFKGVSISKDPVRFQEQERQKQQALDTFKTIQPTFGETLGGRPVAAVLQSGPVVAVSQGISNIGIATRALFTSEALKLETDAATLTSQLLTGQITQDEAEKQAVSIAEQAEKIQTDFEALPEWQQLLWESPAFIDGILSLGRVFTRLTRAGVRKITFAQFERQWRNTEIFQRIPEGLKDSRFAQELKAASWQNFTGNKDGAKRLFQDSLNRAFQAGGEEAKFAQSIVNEGVATGRAARSARPPTRPPTDGQPPIPQATATGATRTGGLAVGQPINQATWDSLSTTGKAALAESKGLPTSISTKAWTELTPAEVNTLSEIPEVTQVPGTPEAGLQADIFGGVTEVRPAGRGRVTQISMDDQLLLEQQQALAEIEGLKEFLSTDPVALARFTLG